MPSNNVFMKCIDSIQTTRRATGVSDSLQSLKFHPREISHVFTLPQREGFWERDKQGTCCVMQINLL